MVLLTIIIYLLQDGCRYTLHSFPSSIEPSRRVPDFLGRLLLGFPLMGHSPHLQPRDDGDEPYGRCDQSLAAALTQGAMA